MNKRDAEDVARDTAGNRRDHEEGEEDARFEGWLIARGYDPRDVGEDVRALRREFYEDCGGQ